MGGNNVIENSLNHIFTTYKVDQYVWAHTNGESGADSFQVLMSRYGEMIEPPWVGLRKRLGKMRDAARDPELFDFEFSDPGNEDISFVNHVNYSFATRLTNRATGKSYSTQNLSSGEKVLMTLCLASFNWSMGCRLPDLVLLDEVDAMLHPSMAAALVDSVKTLFVENGTKVIMATQSVTTAAVLEEGEICRMSRRDGAVEVRPVMRTDAVSELSEGVATIDRGLKIALSDVAPVTILTEGNNVLHLKKWTSLYFSGKVGVFDGLRDKTGANQLCTYGQLLAKLKTNSYFLVVWDWDAKKHLKELSEATNVRGFAFEQRANSIAPKGIENKYDEDVLERFADVTTAAVTQRQHRSLGKVGKARFAEFIFDKGTKEHFLHFGDLQRVVESILEEVGA